MPSAESVQLGDNLGNVRMYGKGNSINRYSQAHLYQKKDETHQTTDAEMSS
ncbi:hypothetical protein [Spirosoma foliorum]|uniref:Uncharacterized protein n=1 Tax=Spirosoma foliorum TaxID=2710596 RepID=A0A7G5H3I2_9BACT|nr:hypothetical protein [Spirosoma foliorum]QMW05674.1 hypothetical protein H3H32_12675 [Spirosoma foliorum]